MKKMFEKSRRPQTLALSPKGFDHAENYTHAHQRHEECCLRNFDGRHTAQSKNR
jgi:hypothetical protein